jgi:Tfp pilus assembly protein PilF
MHGDQNDLNITIDILDDVLNNIAQTYEEGDLKNIMDTIHRLDSVNLEILYNMTRYPNWNIQDIIGLDESFRGESKSDHAIARRKKKLEEKRIYFVNLGLMADDRDQYTLVGGEFLSLYLRFFYETRKYGELSRRLILGKGPPTPFGETTEKLVRSLAYSLGQSPELQRLILHQYHRDFGDIIGTIKRRFSILEDLKKGKKPKGKDVSELISDCFRVCELIGKEGTYSLLCLSVRSRENPRELIQVELYFDLSEGLSIDLGSLFNLLNQQAEDARVLIEGYDNFLVNISSLEKLLAAAGTSFEEFTEMLPLVGKWRMSSVKYELESRNEKEDQKDVDEEKQHKWVTLYGKGEEKEAEEFINQRFGEIKERNKRAELYNDLGYIRCGDKLKKNNLAQKDFETALDLHYSQLSLTLLNLSYLDINEGRYDKAIEKIEAALLLTLSPIQIGAEYLRLRLPEYHLFRSKWEQHPANILETSYINLAYALLNLKGYKEAHQALLEGTELFPSSARLKYAMARLYLFNKRADLAIPIYKELSELPSLPDRGIELEIRHFSSRLGKRKKLIKKRA